MSRVALAALGVFVAASITPSAFAQNLDILSQRVRVDLSAAETRIELEVTLQATGMARGLDLLTPPLPVVSLTVDGQPAVAAPHPSEPRLARTIAFAQAVPAGQTVVLRLALAGDLDCRAFNDPRAIACVRGLDRTVLIPAQVGTAWYLLNLYATDPFTGSVEVRVPSEQVVSAAQGEARMISDGGDGTATWHFDYDVPTERLQINAGNLSVLTSSTGFPVRGYFVDSADQRSHMQEAVTLAAQLIPIYERLYGDLALDEATLLSVPPGFEFGGLGLLGTVLAGEYVFGELDYLLVQGVAHEFAHTWWGNLAAADDPVESAFFGESFAEYAAWRALGELRGEATRTAGVRMNAVWYMYGRTGDADVAVLDPNGRSSPAYIFALYHKGSVALRALETRAGSAAFERALHRLAGSGPSGLSVQALASAIEAEGGGDQRAVIDGWLRRTDFPRLTVTASRSAAALRLEIQTTTPVPLTLPVQLRRARGPALSLELSITDGTTEHTLELPEDVVSVELDPSWTSVRQIRPTLPMDVTFDGRVDAYDLLEVALHQGTRLPATRRVDGGYDPLYDVRFDRQVDATDVVQVLQAP